MCQPKQTKNRVLRAIYDAKKPLCFSEIKAHTGVDHICGALRSLQNEKLIRACFTDRRKWYELTCYGEEAAKRIRLGALPVARSKSQDDSGDMVTECRRNWKNLPVFQVMGSTRRGGLCRTDNSTGI